MFQLDPTHSMAYAVWAFGDNSKDFSLFLSYPSLRGVYFHKLQARNEKIEQLESDLNLSEKVKVTISLSFLFLVVLGLKRAVSFCSKLTSLGSFILLNKNKNWTWKVNSRIAR